MDSNFSKLTILILSLNRQDLALRSMHYWDRVGPSVLVVDGSLRPVDPSALRGLSSRIQYLHRPVGFYARISEAITLVKSKYVMFACDDEFYIPSALLQCINEMDANSHLVACCGRAIRFSVKDHSVFGSRIYSRLGKYSLCHDDPSSRVLYHMENYVPSLFYAVSRTEPWLVSWRHIIAREFPVYAISEIQLELCMSFAGKSKVIDRLMWLRSYGEADAIRGTDISLRPAHTVPLWWSNKDNNCDQADFLAIMNAAYQELRPIGTGVVNFRELLSSAVEVFIGFLSSRKSSAASLELIKRESVVAPLKQLVGDIESEGVHIDHSELDYVAQLIQNFHKGRMKEIRSSG